MIINSVRRSLVALAAIAALFISAEASAFCCGGGGHTAYYGGAYTAAYPTAHQSYYSGWYPGYYLDRVRARLWGSPSTYVASYPVAYSASYAPAYSVGYQPAYTAGYATSYAAPSGCSTCASHTVGYAPSCSTCAPVQQVTLRPVCTTACAPACSTCESRSTCSTCSAPAVSQTSYQEPARCASCGNGAPVQSQTTVIERSPTPAPSQQTFDAQNNGLQSEGAPSIEQGSNVPLQREEQKPPVNGAQQDLQPLPGDDSTENNAEEDPYDVLKGDNSTYFQAPKLFDPNDRTAQRSVSPVTKAVYHKPVSYRNVSTRPVTAQQAEQDAVGWTSASK